MGFMLRFAANNVNFRMEIPRCYGDIHDRYPQGNGTSQICKALRSQGILDFIFAYDI